MSWRSEVKIYKAFMTRCCTKDLKYRHATIHLNKLNKQTYAPVRKGLHSTYDTQSSSEVRCFSVFPASNSTKIIYIMSSTGQYYGWDLLMKSISNDIKDKTDLIVALIHWYLTKNAHFRCLGLGDDRTLKPEDEDSELLPSDWNNFKDKYTLRYRFENDLYILFASKTEFAVLFNLLNCKTMDVSNLSLSPKRVVNSTKGSLNQAIPNVSEILNRISYELIEPVFKGNTREMETQTRPDYLQPQSEPKRGKKMFPPIIHPTADPRNGNGSYGRQDIDPLGRFHGDPSNPFGIPYRPQRYMEPNFAMFAPPDVQGSRNFAPRSNFDDYFM